MQESSLNKYKNWPKHEIFSKTCIPPETLFFVRLDGWRFKKTPQWQRRGILMCKQRLSKKAENHTVIRWVIRENWNLPLLTTKRGVKLIYKILEWTKKKRKE